MGEWNVGDAMNQVVKSAVAGGMPIPEINNQLTEASKDIEGIISTAEQAVVADMKAFTDVHNSGGPGTSVAGEEEEKEEKEKEEEEMAVSPTPRGR